MPLNCTNEFPLTEVLYEDLKVNQYPEVLVLLALAILLCVVLLILCIESAVYVFKFHSNKQQKIRIQCLLALCPIIAWTSLLALLVPRSTLLAEFVASIYLSFCIVIFMNLAVEYFGGTTKLLEEMSGTNMAFGVPPCCCCCICCNNKVKFNEKSLRIPKVLVLQVAIVRPIVLFLAAALWADDKYSPGDEGAQSSASFVIQVFSGVSTVLAIWGLQIVHRATRDRLNMFRMKLKFACFQLCLVFLNLQNFIIAILGSNGIPSCEGSRGPLIRGSRLNHYMLVLEMFLIGILARFAYRRQEAKNMQAYNLQTINSDDNEVKGIDNFVDITTAS